MLKAGESAPDFTLAAHDGSRVVLSSLRGSKVLLWFFPKPTPQAEQSKGAGSATK